MKFTHSLAFNAVPEWKDGYINYKKLTSLAYDAERHAAAAAAASAEGDERSARLSLAAASDAEAAFKRTLESERHKCLDFFAEKVRDRHHRSVDGGREREDGEKKNSTLPFSLTTLSTQLNSTTTPHSNRQEAELIASTRLLEERLAALESMTDTPPAHLLNPSLSAPLPPLTTAAATAATAGLPPPPPRSPRSPGAAAAIGGGNNSSSAGSIDAAAAAAEEQQQPLSPIAALRAQQQQRNPSAAFDPLRSPLLARRSLTLNLSAAEQGASGSGGAALAHSSSLFHTSPSGPAGGGGDIGGYSTSAMALTRRARALLRLRLRSGEAKAEVSDLRLEAEELFVALAGLVAFVDINKTGFRKALKKHDKVAVVDGVPGLEVRPLSSSETAETIARAFDERCRTSALEEAMEAVVLSYAVLATGGELGAAAAELRGRLRDRLVIERGTVWQEMVSRERRTAAARVVGGGGGGGERGVGGVGIGGPGGGLRRSSLDLGRGGGGEAANAALHAGGGSGHGGQAARKLLLGPAAASAASGAAPSSRSAAASAACFGSTTALAVAAASALFFALLASPLFPHAPEKRNCLALLAFVSVLWTTEAIPLYATSMLVPALVIGLRVMVSPLPDPETGHRRRLLPKEAAPLVFSAMMSQVIMLLLGKFFSSFFPCFFPSFPSFLFFSFLGDLFFAGRHQRCAAEEKKRKKTFLQQQKNSTKKTTHRRVCDGGGALETLRRQMGRLGRPRPPRPVPRLPPSRLHGRRGLPVDVDLQRGRAGARLLAAGPRPAHAAPARLEPQRRPHEPRSGPRGRPGVELGRDDEPDLVAAERVRDREDGARCGGGCRQGRGRRRGPWLARVVCGGAARGRLRRRGVLGRAAAGVPRREERVCAVAGEAGGGPRAAVHGGAGGFLGGLGRGKEKEERRRKRRRREEKQKRHFFFSQTSHFFLFYPLPFNKKKTQTRSTSSPSAPPPSPSGAPTPASSTSSAAWASPPRCRSWPFSARACSPRTTSTRCSGRW